MPATVRCYSLEGFIVRRSLLLAGITALITAAALITGASPANAADNTCTVYPSGTEGSITAGGAYTSRWGYMTFGVTHDGSTELEYDLQAVYPIKTNSFVYLFMADGTKKTLNFPSNDGGGANNLNWFYWNAIDHPATARKIEFHIYIGTTGEVWTCGVTLTW